MVFAFCRWMEEQAWLGGYDIHINNVTESISCLGLAGPRSRDVLSKLTSIDLSNEAFPFLHCRTATIAGCTVRALRISYTGLSLFIPHNYIINYSCYYLPLMQIVVPHTVPYVHFFIYLFLSLSPKFSRCGKQQSDTKTPPPIELVN